MGIGGSKGIFGNKRTFSSPLIQEKGTVKLQKSTGLDLRVFEDAITFKIALMVVKYMKYMETLEY